MSETYLSLPDSKWDCKVPSCVRAQATTESDPNASTTWGNLPRAGSAKGVSNY